MSATSTKTMPKMAVTAAGMASDDVAYTGDDASFGIQENVADRQIVEDSLKFVLTRPMATPREMGAAFDQFIAAAADLAGCMVQGRITPGLSGVTISWDKRTVPSREWLRGLEAELVAFGACSGLQVWFRRH